MSSILNIKYRLCCGVAGRITCYREEQKPGVKVISDGSFYFSWSSGREKSANELCSQEGLSGQEQYMASAKAETHCFDWGLWRHLE